MSVLFVAGCGTDIGKTYVAVRVIEALRASGRRVVALKPVASGVPAIDEPAFADSDTARLLRAQNLAIDPETVAACSPWRFSAALSPDMAAAAEGRSLRLAEVVAFARRSIAANPDALIVIEGVGGVMSPICEDATNLDLIAALPGSTVVVAGSYLGAISHALSALEALKARAAAVAGVVVNESEGSGVALEATIDSIHRFSKGVMVAPLRRNEDGLSAAVLWMLLGEPPGDRPN